MSSVQASAARTPRTLLAAICSPLPEPPSTMPRLPRSLTTACGSTQDVRRVVVDGVELDRPVVDDVVPLALQPGDEVGLELEAGVVGPQVHAHGRQSDSRAVSGQSGVPAASGASMSGRCSGTVASAVGESGSASAGDGAGAKSCGRLGIDPGAAVHVPVARLLRHHCLLVSGQGCRVRRAPRSPMSDQSKIGSRVAGALELEEPVGAGDEQHPVPEPAGGLAAWASASPPGRRTRRPSTEMTGVPTSMPTWSMPGVVGLLELLVVVGRGHRVGQLGGQARPRPGRPRRWPGPSAAARGGSACRARCRAAARTSSPCAAAAAMTTRTGPQACAISSW